jgi:hypothetical protein
MAPNPVWEPLIRLAPDHVPDFMWMYSVELVDGTRLQAYKHRLTRRYLYLDDGGRAFARRASGGGRGARYEEVGPGAALAETLRNLSDSL